MSKVSELFGAAASIVKLGSAEWQKLIANQICPFTKKRCFKVRKSQADISIGTCVVKHGRDDKDVIICPHRMLERRQVFADCVHLLTKHEPGNEFHIVPEVSIPGGSVDYFLVSARSGKVKDFVGIEFQTMDTTGTVWPERQRLVRDLGFLVDKRDADSDKPFGMNWKMTAKTILVQLHHKIDTFEHIGKHLVLVVQDHLLEYMQGEFSFAHLSEPGKLGDSMHFHAYALKKTNEGFRLELSRRLSTDSAGIAACMGLQAEAKMEYEEIIKAIEEKMSPSTLLTIA